MLKKVYLFVVISSLINCSLAQSWRSELYPEDWKPDVSFDFYRDKFIQDFSYAGYHLGKKKVPFRSVNIVNVTNPPYNADNTGQKDVTLILQKVIDEVGSSGGGILYLPAGTYKISSSESRDHCLLIKYSNVVFRGAGKGSTFIFNTSTSMRGKSIIKIGDNAFRSAGVDKRRIVKDIMHPAKVIPIQDVNGYNVGDVIVVRNYINNDWVEEHRMSAHWKDKGSVFGGQVYYRQITSVNKKTNELTLDIPIRYALKTDHKSTVYKLAGMLTEVGVEDFSIGNIEHPKKGDWTEESYHDTLNGSYDCHDSWAIAMSNAYNGWIKNIASYQHENNKSKVHVLSNGIKLSETKNISIINCDFRSPQFGGGGGNGYMYRIMANETLIDRCVADFNRHGFVLSGMTASGNVFHRCIDRNSGRQRGSSGDEKTNGSGSDHHMHFSHSNLFDQCSVEDSYFAAGWRKWGGETIHGLTSAHSVYWNTISNGTQDYAVETQQGRYGYVIGTNGDKPTVRTTPWEQQTDSITNPIDYTEGIGKGSSLKPQSLYLDQRKKRIRK